MTIDIASLQDLSVEDIDVVDDGAAGCWVEITDAEGRTVVTVPFGASGSLCAEESDAGELAKVIVAAIRQWAKAKAGANH